MLTLLEGPLRAALLRVPAATRGVVSWNATAPSGEIALTAHRTGGSVSRPLPYARWSPAERRSLNGADERTRIAIDTLKSDEPFAAVGVETNVTLDAVALSVPPRCGERRTTNATSRELDVPALSQYLQAYPDARGWCSAASLAMLLRFHDVEATVPETAAATFDASYGGTGNWALNAAYAGRRGLRAVVAYLDGLDHAAAFVDAGLPVAISISWRAGELPGAPLEHSEGHLLVVRGVGAQTVAVNDPAHPTVATRYPRAALDRVFRQHGGVSYLVAPRERSAELVRLANLAVVR